MSSPAIDVGKRNQKEKEIVMLSTGIRARIVPVGASLIDDVVAQIRDPKPPVIFIESKGREEENPNDPEYLEALAAATRRRSVAAMDAMILFGLELVDELPDDDTWLRKLRWLESKRYLDLSEYDQEDPFEREFLYKRYVACGTQDLILIGKAAGLSADDIAEAAEAFKS